MKLSESKLRSVIRSEIKRQINEQNNPRFEDLGLLMITSGMKGVNVTFAHRGPIQPDFADLLRDELSNMGIRCDDIQIDDSWVSMYTAVNCGDIYGPKIQKIVERFGVMGR